jgi:NAD(P)-dependent dehydrogenase (short-subunit alcohol dehydrogenase family)
MIPSVDSSGQPDPSSSGRRVAIITGGSQGIGAGLVSGFRREGYAVVATSRSIAAADEDDYLTVRGDIADAQTSRSVVEQALDRFARIDGLVNDAGVFIGKSFTDYTLEDYDLITSVNLAGFFHMTQRVIGHMITQGSGHVVNVTTSLADKADSKTPAALTALTKGGLGAATRSLAIEYASRGIRVNAVALGIVRTTDDLTSYEGMAELHPLGRLGEIGDVVDGVLYLDRATFVTGETLHIDGGRAAGH